MIIVLNQSRGGDNEPPPFSNLINRVLAKISDQFFKRRLFIYLFFCFLLSLYDRVCLCSVFTGEVIAAALLGPPEGGPRLLFASHVSGMWGPVTSSLEEESGFSNDRRPLLT